MPTHPALCLDRPSALSFRRQSRRSRTQPDDLVVDPAGGSFGVMHAARQLGRNFIGCDIAHLPSADVGQIPLAEQAFWSNT
jgi:hypothetical protein